MRAGMFCFTAAILNLAMHSAAIAAPQNGGKGQASETLDENQDAKQQTERERQAEAREAEQERVERMQELYDQGREAPGCGERDRRQVVEHQRAGMDHLDRAGGRQGILDTPSTGFRRQENEQRPQAFAGR